MSKSATLSTLIDPEVKRAVNHYCKRRGLKLRYVVERALVEQLEDEIDLQAYLTRRDEENYSLDDVLAGRRQAKTSPRKR